LLGCFGARDRGTCTNTLRISRLDVESRVLGALQTKLLRSGRTGKVGCGGTPRTVPQTLLGGGVSDTNAGT
jgi:hypothetical protein